MAPQITSEQLGAKILQISLSFGEMNLQSMDDNFSKAHTNFVNVNFDKKTF